MLLPLSFLFRGKYRVEPQSILSPPQHTNYGREVLPPPKRSLDLEPKTTMPVVGQNLSRNQAHGAGPE